MSVALNAAIESYAFLCPDCSPWRQNAVADALGDLDALAVVAEERPVREVAVELRAVGQRAGADAVEDLDRHAARVVVGLAA